MVDSIHLDVTSTFVHWFMKHGCSPVRFSLDDKTVLIKRTLQTGTVIIFNRIQYLDATKKRSI